MQPSWLRRREREEARKTTREADDGTRPLDVMIRLMQRCCDVIATEDKKGAAADGKRIDRALRTAAALARGAAPYCHRRMKPADLAPGEPRKQEIIVSWKEPDFHKDDSRTPALVPERR